MAKTKKHYKRDYEDHVVQDEIDAELNNKTLLQHHPTIPSLMVPLYDPVRPEIMNPKSRLVTGSTITIGMNAEQRDEEMKFELERRRIERLNS
jgi:hypothetical protein